MNCFVMRRLTVILPLLALLSSGVNAQKSWTLNDCISYALQNNIQLKRQELQVNASQKDYRQGIMEFAPSITSGAQHTFVSGREFNQYSLSFEDYNNQEGYFYATASLDLFKGFANWNGLRALKYELESARAATENLKNDIAVNVSVGYLQVLYALESRTLAEKQVQVAEIQSEKAAMQFELGSLSQGQMVEVKAQYLLRKAELTNAVNNYNISVLDLKQMLEIPDSTSFSIDSAPIQLEKPSANVSVSLVYEEALAVQPAIRKAELDIKAANKRLNQLYGSLSPSLSVGYQISSGYNQSAGYKVSDTEWVFYPDYTYGEQIKDFLNQRVYFNLTIPIFQKYNRITRIGKGKITLLDARYAKEQAEKGLLKKVEQAHADSKASWDKYLASKESVAAFTEVFEETRKKFELGMVSAIDLGLAQSNLVKAEGDLLHAKYSYVLRTKILDFYRGVPISI